MKHSYTLKGITLCVLQTLFGTAAMADNTTTTASGNDGSRTPPPVGCTNTDYGNSFLNSVDPASIEYDNMVSTLHSTMARPADGAVKV
jgi:hypothetical protein